LREKSEYFSSRQLAPSEIRMAASWAGYLQEKYIASKGSTPGAVWAMKTHGNAHNFFIFGLATVSAFYATGHWGGKSVERRLQTLVEFPERSSSMYSPIPPRGEVRERPRLHTEELIKHVYGLIYHANDELGLLVEKVSDYAVSRNTVRAHYQQLHEYAVKKRCARELLNLHTNFWKYLNTDYVSFAQMVS
jgi:hypothetical protein